MQFLVAIGYLFCVLGIVMNVLGGLNFLAIAYRQGAGWFLSCALVPFFGWIFFLFNARNTLRPVVIQVAGAVIYSLGCWLKAVPPQGWQ